MTALVDGSQPAEPKKKPEARIPGEAGMWVFIFGDMILFTVYFSSYLRHRIAEPAVFREGQALLNQHYAAVETLVLLMSSLFVFIGLQAVRQRQRVIGPRMFGAAMLCALAFTALKLCEWHAKISHGVVPGTSTFIHYYFVLTGLHLVHVLLGIGVLNFLRTRSRRSDITQTQFMFIEGGACWWHMVDLIWMILFPLVYLAR